MPRPRPIPVPIPVPTPIPSAQACFYQGENFTGRSLCVSPGQVITNVYDYGMNNTFSSAIVPYGYQITVWEYANFGGDSLVLQGQIPSLSVYGSYWNNQISAIDFRY